MTHRTAIWQTKGERVMEFTKPYLCEVFREGMKPGGYPLHDPIAQCRKCEMAMASVAVNDPASCPTLFGRERHASEYVAACESCRRVSPETEEKPNQ